MPLHTVEKNIAEVCLVELAIEDVPRGGLPLTMYPSTATRIHGARGALCDRPIRSQVMVSTKKVGFDAPAFREAGERLE